MPIYQTNVWICEVCGEIESITKKVSSYEDPIVYPPKGANWDYITIDSKEKLACPHCVWVNLK